MIEYPHKQIELSRIERLFYSVCFSSKSQFSLQLKCARALPLGGSPGPQLRSLPHVTGGRRRRTCFKSKLPPHTSKQAERKQRDAQARRQPSERANSMNASENNTTKSSGNREEWRRSVTKWHCSELRATRPVGCAPLLPQAKRSRTNKWNG